MFDTIPAATSAAIIGAIGGLVLGLAARLGEFCTLGAIESAWLGEDQKRLRMWGIVLGVAIITTHGMASIGQVDLAATIYHRVAWNPVASILGGLIFGYGMAYAGNCGFGALTRFGGGDLRSLVVVVIIAIFGRMTLDGPLTPILRPLFAQEPAVGPQGYAQLFAALTGLPPFLLALAVGLALIGWALAYAPLRARRDMMAWSVLAGLAIASAFWGTTAVHVASMGETGVEGHTFVGPLGRTLMFLMTSSAFGMNFAVGSVSGVLVGAFIGSMIRGRFRWEACEDPRELGRQVGGAALMGVGGVIALGCSIGQGASAFATLAYSGPVTLAAIVAGAVIGLRHLLRGFAPGD